MSDPNDNTKNTDPIPGPGSYAFTGADFPPDGGNILAGTSSVPIIKTPVAPSAPPEQINGPGSYSLGPATGFPADSGNLLETSTVASTAVTLDNPYAAEVQIASANQQMNPQSSPGLWQAISDGASSLWDSSWGKWAIGGAAIGLTILLITSLASRGGSSAPVTLPAQMTAAQKLQAQTLVDKQLASADRSLKAAGASAQAISEAHNNVAIVDGTQITLATAHSNTVATPKKVTVTGTTSPDHYVLLSQVNAKMYTQTLSATPTLSDLTNNAAVIHDIKSTDH